MSLLNKRSESSAGFCERWEIVCFNIRETSAESVNKRKDCIFIVLVRFRTVSFDFVWKFSFPCIFSFILTLFRLTSLFSNVCFVIVIYLFHSTSGLSPLIVLKLLCTSRFPICTVVQQIVNHEKKSLFQF